jgi:hypothetical protein
VYKGTPVINNEMINKEILSSPIYKARNIVIDTILNNDVSMIKNITSAESTINKAVEESSNINNNNMENIVEKIKRYIEKAYTKKISFEDICLELYAPPYGIRKGILPILIAKALKNEKDSVILHYQDKEIEIEGKNISKIIDTPEKYFISIEKDIDNKINFVKELMDTFKAQKTDNHRENIKILIDSMKKWILGLPRLTRDLNKINEIIKDQTYISIKNELLKSYINNNEFLFKKTEEIFCTDDYNEIIKKFNDLKNIFDNYLKNYSQNVISLLKKVFPYNSTSNLKYIISNWYENVESKIKLSIIRLEIKNLFEYIESIDTYDEVEIIQKISHILLGFYIEDWQEDTHEQLLKKINDILEEIKRYKNIDINKQIVLSISDGDKEIKKYIDSSEINGIGITLKNNIEESLSEYGDSISESDKMNILLSIIKKYV